VRVLEDMVGAEPCERLPALRRGLERVQQGVGRRGVWDDDEANAGRIERLVVTGKHASYRCA
jgi:hypothetical protein